MYVILSYTLNFPANARLHNTAFLANSRYCVVSIAANSSLYNIVIEVLCREVLTQPPTF